MVDTFNDTRSPYQGAFPLWELRLYEEWNETFWNGGTGDLKGPLEDDHIVYIQDDYSVIRGSYNNKNIVLPADKVTEEWKEYCKEALHFEIPAWTQESKEWEVISGLEKEQMREEYKKKKEEKIRSAPNVLTAYDVIPDVIPSYTNQVELKVVFFKYFK